MHVSTINYISGSVWIFGNGFTLIILCSSPKIRNKTVNIFLISQSLLDFLCAVVLIGTAWRVVWGQEAGHFGILGKVFFCWGLCLTILTTDFYLGWLSMWWLLLMTYTLPSVWKQFMSLDNLKEHQKFLANVIFQKFLITMVVYEKFLLIPWKYF